VSENDLMVAECGTRKTTYPRWQERLSKHDGGRARDPCDPQNRRETLLDDLQNSFLGPRSLNQGAIRQKYRDLNRSDDEQARSHHPQLYARTGSSREDPVHGLDQGVT
jgi:hypothetical protein